MAEHGAVEAIEIERKYEVSESVVLPDLKLLDPQSEAATTTEVYELRATYFDTTEGLLGQHRVAVRRREGGSDAGWHLKTKNGDRSRELLWPLSEEMPQGLRDAVVELIGAEALQMLVPIADMRTVRRVTRWAPGSVVDAAVAHGHEAGAGAGAGAAQPAWVVEVADDSVQGTNELTGVVQHWREWEAELAPGADPAWLDTVEPLLLDAGAQRVHGTSKLQRIMGRPARASAEHSEQQA